MGEKLGKKRRKCPQSNICLSESTHHLDATCLM
jgi:hypothetical protein